MAPLEYYVTAVLCAAAGALLGGLPRTGRAIIRNAVWCSVVVAVTAAIEIVWHESPPIHLAERPRLFVAMILALFVPATVAFISSQLATKAGWSKIGRILASALSALPALLFYPLYGLYLVCYVGHDCI